MSDFVGNEFPSCRDRSGKSTTGPACSNSTTRLPPRDRRRTALNRFESTPNRRTDASTSSPYIVLVQFRMQVLAAHPEHLGRGGAIAGGFFERQSDAPAFDILCRRLDSSFQGSIAGNSAYGHRIRTDPRARCDVTPQRQRLITGELDGTVRKMPKCRFGYFDSIAIASRCVEPPRGSPATEQA